MAEQRYQAVLAVNSHRRGGPARGVASEVVIRPRPPVAWDIMCRVTEQDESIDLSWTPRPAELGRAPGSQPRPRRLVGPRRRCCRAGTARATMLASPFTLPMALVLFVVALFLVWMRATATIMRRRWVLAVAGNPALTETVEAQLDASGIRTDGERMSIARRWSAFTSWSDTPGAVVFATGDNVHGAVLVVPTSRGVWTRRVGGDPRAGRAAAGPAARVRAGSTGASVVAVGGSRDGARSRGRASRDHH